MVIYIGFSNQKVAKKCSKILFRGLFCKEMLKVDMLCIKDFLSFAKEKLQVYFCCAVLVVGTFRHYIESDPSRLQKSFFFFFAFTRKWQ